MAVAAVVVVVRLAAQKQTDSTKEQSKTENWKQSLPPLVNADRLYVFPPSALL